MNVATTWEKIKGTFPSSSSSRWLSSRSRDRQTLYNSNTLRVCVCVYLITINKLAFSGGRSGRDGGKEKENPTKRKGSL